MSVCCFDRVFQLDKTLYNEDDFSGLIQNTNRTTVVMAEQEAEHNEPRMEAKVANSF